MGESFMKRVEDIQRAGFDHLQKEEEKFLLREDGVRSNYDSVVEKLDGERRLVVEQLSSQLGVAATKLDNLIASNAQLAQQLADLSSRVDRFERDMSEIRAALNQPRIAQNQ
jgi:seryl-tRNA synthetase